MLGYSLSPLPLTILVPNTFGEEVPSECSVTIGHLIDYLSNSGLIFIRNDQEYDAHAAAIHLKDKYNYLQTDIQTPEQFIEKVGSKSMLSGKLYLVRLKDGTTVALEKWLREELVRFSNSKK